MGMNNEPSVRIARQFFLLNRNIERLINSQLAIVGPCPLNELENIWLIFDLV